MQHLVDSEFRVAAQRGRRAVIALVLAAATPAAAMADESPTILHDFSIEFGAEIASEYGNNLNLNRNEDSDVGVVEAEISAALTYQPSDNFEAEVGLVLGRYFFFVDQAEEENEVTILELDKANVTISDVPVDGLSVALGRMKLRDQPRFFLFDTTLDGVRATYESGRVSLDGSFSREKIVDIDLLRDEANPQVNYAAAFLDIAVAESAVVGPYFFLRDGEAEQEGELYFMGLRSSGEIADGWRHWIDLSHVTGDDGQTDVSGYAVDTALTRVFDAPFQPSVTLGYAFGSGDDDPNDGVDRAYRQTGLHKNEARFNGVPRFQYLGEVFNPELANLHVFTVGAGARDEDVSLDLVFHHYRLDEYADELGNARIEGDLRPASDGKGKGLGNEIDLVVGFENLAGVSEFAADFSVGYFWNGDAFAADNDDDAFFVSLDAEVAF